MLSKSYLIEQVTQNATCDKVSIKTVSKWVSSKEICSQALTTKDISKECQKQYLDQKGYEVSLQNIRMPQYVKGLSK